MWGHAVFGRGLGTEGQELAVLYLEFLVLGKAHWGGQVVCLYS